jgi:hypothetical protein
VRSVRSSKAVMQGGQGIARRQAYRGLGPWTRRRDVRERMSAT